MNDLVESLAREIASLRDEVRDLRWRQKNMIRPMVASEVDNRRGLVRADAGGFQTPWMQAFHQGGAVRSFSPIAAGEILSVFAPGGDVRQAFAFQGGFSDKNAKPTDREDEQGVWYGATSLFQRPDAAGLFGPNVDLGDAGGPPVARVGDLVHVTFGSSAGLHPIVTGSSLVRSA